MKKVTAGIKKRIWAHKITSAIILIVIVLVGYWGYKKFTSAGGEPRYVIAKVERGDIIASISGSGQVSSLNQVEVKAKASGDVAYLAVKDGQKIGAGGIIARLDDFDAQKSVRDTEVNLESARISLEKLKIEKSAENMNADLAKAYDDGFNVVSNVFLDLPEIMIEFHDMFFKSDSATGQWNVDWYEGKVDYEERDKTIIFKQNFINSYNKAKDSYDENFNDYKIVSRTSEKMAIETLIAQTYDTTKLISDAIKNANNYVDFVNSSIQDNNFETPTLITTHRASLNGYTAKTNSHLLSLLSVKTNIKNYKDSFVSADLDIQSSELSVKQRENALQDAKEKLTDYFIRAPFEGTIAKVSIKKSDTVSSSAVVATLITKLQLAEISLNEVDVAKIKIGQKAILTFDAIPDLALSGAVADIDSIGAVSQGVVTYIVKVSFDAQDERVKPGMSVNTVIVTDMRQDVLAVPNSAIKSLPARLAGQTGKSYVEIFNIPLTPPADGLIGFISKIAPDKIPVEIGLSNDSQTEIISGIKEGDEIVARTILPSTATNTSATPSIFGGTTGNRTTGSGNAVRIPSGR